MNIIVDAFGGDNAPLAVLQGAEMAIKEQEITVTLVGDEAKIHQVAADNGVSLKGMEILHTSDIMPVEVEPHSIRTQYADSSMGLALRTLADGQGDAVVSAGSTGALVVGATLWVKRIRGIRRPAIGVVIPNAKGVHMMVDSGANAECRPEMLLQFGIMGSVYMQKLMGIENPRVGMVNIGTEPNKGTDLQIQASQLLEKAPINFIGNVEASQLPVGGCDVAVTDGFTGNILLKHTEGMAKMMAMELNKVFFQTMSTKIAAMMLKKPLKKSMAKLNPSEYGGVPLLGVTKPVVKAHGNSNAVAFKNAIGQAVKVAEQEMIGQIEQALEQMKEQAEQTHEEL